MKEIKNDIIKKYSYKDGIRKLALYICNVNDMKLDF